MKDKNNLQKKIFIEQNSLLQNLFGNELLKFKFTIEDDDTVIFENEKFLEVMSVLQNNSLKFETLIDIVAVDYSDYEISEWNAKNANNKGYSRGVKKDSSGRYTYESSKTHFNQPKKRFGVIYNLLSVSSNTRLKVKFYCEDDTNPSLPTATTIWASANWYEREAYDLLGIIFINHPDLRRLLTDYGFIGHPLRKDFPLIGNVEVNYDLEKQRVVYQPVTIKPRVLIPKVIREVLEKEDKNA
jgi:NADH-quinone oxidoreductase subunit C